MPKPQKGFRSGKAKKATKKAKKTEVKKPKKILSEEDAKKLKEEKDNLKCIELIGVIRSSNDKKLLDEAFSNIFETIKPQMQYIVNRFTIPGLNHDDIMQEALFALRYKAIKDYDQTRGSGKGPASFKLFALLCIRRHLTTERKSSLFNNRKKILNQSMSLDQENKSSSNEDLSLANIVCSKQDGVLEGITKNETYRNLMLSLVRRLSKFEREVLVLYAQSCSYEEIAAKINEKRVKIKVDVKGIDNALSRIKHKAKNVLEDIEDKVESKNVDNALSRIKHKAKNVLNELDDDEE